MLALHETHCHFRYLSSQKNLQNGLKSCFGSQQSKVPTSQDTCRCREGGGGGGGEGGPEERTIPIQSLYRYSMCHPGNGVSFDRRNFIQEKITEQDLLKNGSEMKLNTPSLRWSK